MDIVGHQSNMVIYGTLISNGYHVDITCLPHCYLMLITWLPLDITWVLPWMLHGYQIDITMIPPWMSHGYHMDVSWLPHGCLMVP